MAVNLFGFEISRAGAEKNLSKQDIILPSPDDGVATVSGGAYGTYINQDYSSKNEQELIKKYREISMHPECEAAIDDIINEAIVSDEEKQVDIILDDVVCQKWKIKEITLKNFMSFGNDITHTINMDKLNGTTSITGKNASGKTTIMLLILYGFTYCF